MQAVLLLISPIVVHKLKKREEISLDDCNEES